MSHAMTAAKSVEECSPRSTHSDRDQDSSGMPVRRLAPGEVEPEDPIERIENLSAEQLREEVSVVRVSGEINATNVPFRQCLNYFAGEISKMICMKKTFIDDLRTLDPARLHQEILRQMLKHPEAVFFFVWMRDSGDEISRILKSRPVESFPSYIMAAFAQFAASTFASIEIQFVSCLLDIILPVLSRYVSERMQSVKDEPVITCNFVIEAMRMTNVADPTPSAPPPSSHTVFL